MVDPDIDAHRLIVLVGPTGSGKTKMVEGLAAQFPVEAVCLDAMQLYRELELGTASPNEAERSVCPHHLFGAFSVREPLTVASYKKACLEKVAEIQARGNLPLLVGGTGMYLRFLFEDLAGLPKTPSPLRARVDQIHARLGSQRTHQMLARLDPQAAARLHPNDQQRIKRFLEVRILTGKSVVDIWADQKPGATQWPIGIGLAMDKSVLWQRLQVRLEAMLHGGWWQEAKALRDAGLRPDVEALGPIGYASLFEALDSPMDAGKVFERIYIQTRQYAKRQMTLFRRFPYIEWFTYHQPSGYNSSELLAFVQSRLT
ncbi:MAG: tRNA (adenosine(37)-N6)-dimethylallyltransferase MiaA [Acidobacteria bacterium]|nr:tRNA (adenosine(37)-N6)-dimethylallyltransferase MiaA [Acidobacteriota bacterium]